jgi:hypothetical protein
VRHSLTVRCAARCARLYSAERSASDRPDDAGTGCRSTSPTARAQRGLRATRSTRQWTSSART